jgi:nitrate reductase delta subunit
MNMNEDELKFEAYARIADMFEYPDKDYLAKVGAGANTDALFAFARAIESCSLSELQEVYTRTFDLNPTGALEIGFHLFGENYKRGEFLANLRETEAPFELGQEHQLPDYLPVLLRLLPKLGDEELRMSLIADCMIPAIDKMVAALKDQENPYRSLLKALRSNLWSEAGESSASAMQGRNSRTSLPVLTSEETNSANLCEAAPEFHRAASDHIDRRAFDLETKRELF